MFSFFKKEPSLVRACKSMSRNNPSAPPSTDADLTKALTWFIVKMSLSYFKETLASVKEINKTLKRKVPLNEDAALVETLIFFTSANQLYLKVNYQKHEKMVREQSIEALRIIMLIIVASRPDWDTRDFLIARNLQYIKEDGMDRLIDNFLGALAAERPVSRYERNFHLSNELLRPLMMNGLSSFLDGHHQSMQRLFEIYFKTRRSA